MFRNLTFLLFIYLLCGAVAAEQWVPMGAGKIYVGAKPGHETPKDAEYRSATMMRQALPTNSPGAAALPIHRRNLLVSWPRQRPGQQPERPQCASKPHFVRLL